MKTGHGVFDVDLVNVASKWHPAILVTLLATFSVFAFLSIGLLVYGQVPSGIALLLLNAICIAWFGKGLTRKYAAELAAFKAEQDKLNT